MRCSSKNPRDQNSFSRGPHPLLFDLKAYSAFKTTLLANSSAEENEKEKRSPRTLPTSRHPVMISGLASKNESSAARPRSKRLKKRFRRAGLSSQNSGAARPKSAFLRERLEPELQRAVRRWNFCDPYFVLYASRCKQVLDEMATSR